MKEKFKVGGLFAGVGGIELGFKKSGFDIAWANEIDKHCAKTYRENFSHPLYDIDIKEDKKVTITHTLTSMLCPAADEISRNIKEATERVAGEGNVKVIICSA